MKIGEEAEETSKKEQELFTESLDNLLKGGASEMEVLATMEEYKQKFSDYGRDRRSAIEFHLKNVQRLLMPTTTTTVAMRALQGEHSLPNDSGFKTNSSRDGDGAATAHASLDTCQELKSCITPLDAPDETSVLSSEAKALSSLKKTSFDEPMPQDTLSLESAPYNKTTTTGTTSSKPLTEEAQSPQQTIATSSSKTAVSNSTDISPLPCQVISTTPEIIKPSAPEKTDQSSPELRPKSLFYHLVNHLEVTPSQASLLKDSRYVAKELDTALVQSLKLLEELKKRLAKCGDDLEAEFDSVRSILTPTQAAKFLIWVKNNGACMYMLDQLWSNKYSMVDDEGDDDEEENSDLDEKEEEGG